MQHIFITDAFSLLLPGHDSTLALMKEAILKKHQIWQCEISDIYWLDNAVYASIYKIEYKETFIRSSTSKQVNLCEEKDWIAWMRKDPPVDYSYIQTCQLLRLCHCRVLNNPDTLMTCDEKLFALEFPDLTPQTIILQDPGVIMKQVKEQGKLIAKPIGNKGGEGIFLLDSSDKNLRSLLELITNNGQQRVILQQYLPAVREGDKRIFLIDGKPLGAVLRVPNNDDHRANMAAGASISKTTITDQEYKICEQLKPRLRELGVYVVGIDVIGDKLTEINITSPTCLEEIAELDGTNPAREIIEWSNL